MLVVVGGHQRDNISMRVLTNKVSKLEELQGARIQTVKTSGIQQHNKILWS
jgi:hypothetical protein